MKYKTRWIIMGVAIVLILLMLASLFISMRKLQTVTRVTMSDYAVGAINESGKVIESHHSLYTKKMLNVEDMKVTLKDDATVSVTVYLYDRDENLLTSYDATTPVNEVSGAKYFRVMITPALVDGEPVDLNALNMHRYTNQVEVLYTK